MSASVRAAGRGKLSLAFAARAGVRASAVRVVLVRIVLISRPRSERRSRRAMLWRGITRCNGFLGLERLVSGLGLGRVVVGWGGSIVDSG